MEFFRPLGHVMTVLETIGHPMTHAYDDLIFIEHSPFLLQFDQGQTQRLYFYGHVEWDQAKSRELWETVSAALQKEGYDVKNQGQFSLDQHPDDAERVNVSFYKFSENSL